MGNRRVNLIHVCQSPIQASLARWPEPVTNLFNYSLERLRNTIEDQTPKTNSETDVM